jgi:hypothetical protein
MAKTKHRDVIKAETVITLHATNAGLNHESKRAAIKAALLAATADLVATTLRHENPVLAEDGDGGAPPWGEVIIGPIWGERNPPEPPRPEVIREAASPEFWQW